MKLRCRLGLHAWELVKVHDPTLEGQGEWKQRCLRCGKQRDVPWRPPPGTA